MSNDPLLQPITNHFNTPAEVAQLTISSGVTKAGLGTIKTLLLAMCAGAFIALGGAASSVAAHDIANVGIARLVTGCIFPVGLILIIVVGGELFTGNCLMVEALCARKIRARAWARNLALAFVGNFLGSVLVVALVALTTQYDYSGGTLGAYTIKIALSKTTMPLLSAFASGILCNILVCVAVLAAFAAKDIVDKILSILLPIMVFVLSGFEHCIANMYFVVAGIIAAGNPTYVARAEELYGLDPSAIAGVDWLGFAHNLIPVTLGNLVGGIAVGLVFYAVFASKRLNRDTSSR